MSDITVGFGPDLAETPPWTCSWAVAQNNRSPPGQQKAITTGEGNRLRNPFHTQPAVAARKHGEEIGRAHVLNSSHRCLHSFPTRRSSDLRSPPGQQKAITTGEGNRLRNPFHTQPAVAARKHGEVSQICGRSEERRVGKECR